MNLARHIGEQASLVNVNPTEAQKLAGNYRKGHIKVHGLDITIENPKGSTRSGTAPDGKKWKSRLPNHYGYIRRTEGGDGDHVDVYVGPHLKSPHVFIIDQHDLKSASWDEHKVFIGFGNKAHALAAYHRAFSDGRGRDRIGHVEHMSIDGFKGWLRDGDTTRAIRRAAGGRVGYAEGGAPPPFEQTSAVPSFDQTEPAQSGSWKDYIPAAVSDIPKEMGHSAMEAAQSLTGNSIKSLPGYDPRPRAELGQWEGMKRSAGQALAIPLGVANTVVGAPLRSLLGHPLAAAEHMVGSIINPDVAAKDDPQKMYDTAKGDVDLAMTAMRPRGVTPRGITAPPAGVAPEVQANMDAANEFGMRLSRGQATGDLDTIRYEDMAARGAYGKPLQDRAAPFFDQQFQDAQAAGRDIGDQTARTAPVVDTPAEAANSVGAEVSDRAAQARAMQAQAERRAAMEAEAQRGMVADEGRTIADTVRGQAAPIGDVREAGEIVGQNVRDAATANRREFQDRYREFGQLPGEFRVDAVRGMGTRVRNDLTYRDEPVVVDDQLTPASSRAIQDLDQMSQPRIQNRASATAEPAPDEIAGVSLRGVDQMRKKLVAYYQASRANPTDSRAMQAIIHAFDGQIERALTENLFSGDPRALQALQEARASYSRYRSTFGPQRQGDDVGAAMRRIVDRNATPEEIVNMVVGSGKIGSAGLPVRIADRLEQVLPPEGWSAVRQAMWQKASQVRNSAGVVDPARSANNITEFSNSTLARRMFSPEELAAMRSHAQGVRNLDQVIEQMPATQNASRAREIYQDVFGGRDLGGTPGTVFKRMVEGTATPEEISNGIFKIIGAGNPGHATRAIRAIERIVGSDSEAMAAVRQGVWRKLTQAPAGKDQPGAQKAMQAINEFLNGSGSSVARALYSPQELALMDRYQHALKLTIIPKYARTNSDTAPALLHAVRKYASMVMGALGYAHGDGGLTGIGVGKLLEAGSEKLAGMRSIKKLNASLENVVPAPRTISPPRPRSALTKFPLTLRGGAYHGPNLGPLQGPLGARADDKQQQP